MEVRTNPTEGTTERVARDLLINRRLTTLRLHDNVENPISIETLGKLVSDAHAEDSRQSGVHRRRVQLALIHSDLPVLERHGLVEVDRADGTVDRVEHLLGVDDIYRSGRQYLSTVEKVIGDGGR